jgi:hypothetical protein
MIMAEAMKPFAEAPVVTIGFTTGSQQRTYPLSLPILATSFFEPVAGLVKDSFMQRWNALADKEQQEIVDGAPGFDLNTLCMALKFGRCEGVDNANTWTGAGTFRTGALAQDGVTKISVGCLVRVEGNGQGKYRVTARTLHPLCSQAVKSVVCAGIKAGP